MGCSGGLRPPLKVKVWALARPPSLSGECPLSLHEVWFIRFRRVVMAVGPRERVRDVTRHMYNARLELQRPRQRVCVVVSTSGGKHGVGGSVGADAVRRGSHIPTTTDGLHKRRESACRRQFCGRPALCRQTALLGARSRWMEPALAWSDSEGLIALASLILAPLPRSRVATA